MELAPLQRLRVLGTETLFAIGGAEECEPTYISSYSSGISWSTNDDLLAGSWYLDPADRTVVATPLGDVDAPCEAVDLAGVDADNAAILCTNGDLAVSSDGGASWQGVDVDGAARAIGIADDGYVLAGEEESCEEGVAVSTLDVTGAGMELDCMAAGLDDATELAVSGAGGAIWLWAEDEVVVSG